MPKLSTAPRASSPATRTLAAIGAGAILLYGSRVLLDFFGNPLPYSMPDTLGAPLDSPDFLRFLSTVTNGNLRPSRLTRLRNGQEFYPAELEAIRGAQHAINLEFYEFLPGQVAAEFLAALTERARAGVQVRVLVDAVGSFGTPDSFFRPLRAAGGHMHWYHPVRWNTWQHLNNRTHRKLIVIDGTSGFLGGAGIGDHWLYPSRTAPTWRDTMFHVAGEAVAGLLSTFSENWLEASGAILSGAEQFNFEPTPGSVPSFVVSSTPHGGGTGARILFTALIKSARSHIRITTPYFLPDKSARQAMVAAVRRGVRVEILTAGPKIDHPVIRKLSRHTSRHLVAGGAHIFEYQPAMIHAKLMTIDGQWSVLGSTNFDHRSFALNDEINLAALDRALAATLDADFADDLAQSRPLTLEMLAKRTLLTTGEDFVDHMISYES